MENEINLRSELKILIDELDALHTGAVDWTPDDGLPHFRTASNGEQRSFTRRATEALRKVTKLLHDNRPADLLKIELQDYWRFVAQAIVDLHADGSLAGFDEADPSGVAPKFRALIEERVAASGEAYTHYFPAWTMGMERPSPFVLGPVTFLNRIDWIDTVDFPPRAKETYLRQPEANARWRDIVKDALQQPRGTSAIDGLAACIYDFVEGCPAVLKVTIRGFELNFSKKLARIAAKAALDAVSLCFAGPKSFHQQALQGERLLPLSTTSLVESNGFLWLPGYSLSSRILSRDPADVREDLDAMSPILSAFARILEGLVDPSSHPHPSLASRWTTALDWFGEGNRESSDAIALAKLGTCLDVLACGGKSRGILDLIVHLTGRREDSVATTEVQPRRLGKLIRDIYDHGRSQILHGSRHNRLESFAADRQAAAYLARVALIESAARLMTYTGADSDTAFRTIGPVNIEWREVPRPRVTTEHLETFRECGEKSFGLAPEALQEMEERLKSGPFETTAPDLLEAYELHTYLHGYVGDVRVTETDDDHVEVSLFTFTRLRKSGIGRRALEEIVNRLTAEGRKIELVIRRENAYRDTVTKAVLGLGFVEFEKLEDKIAYRRPRSEARSNTLVP